MNDFTYAGDYEFVPEGEHQAIVTRYDRCEFYRRKKLYLWFKIVDGTNEGPEIFMPFNVYSKIVRNSKYYKAWVTAKGSKPKKNDRMSPKVFKGKVFLIKVRTVMKGRELEALGEDKYSVVDDIIGVLAGGANL